MRKFFAPIVLLPITWIALQAQTPRASVPAGGADLVPPAIAPSVSIRTEGGKRIIDSNGIPDHTVGRFPRRGKSQQDCTAEVSF